MPDASGAADDVTALRTENGRLREANDRLRVLLEDKDARNWKSGLRGWSG